MKGLMLKAALVTLVLLPLSVFATAKSCRFGNSVMANVTCYGPADMNKTTVTKDIQIEGPLNGVNVTLGSMTVDGPVELHESVVNGLVDVNGFMTAHKVDFHGNMAIETGDMTLDHSSVEGSIKMTSNITNQVVNLECGATVSGSIKFIGHPGVVTLTEDSNIQGRVYNGEIRFVDKAC
jgi:cytoskeletal protein CcmA (bactofilin family)